MAAEIEALEDAFAKESLTDWEGFVLQNRDWAVGLAYHLVGERSMAEDLAQDAFLKAFDKRSTLRDGQRLRPWFARIVVNCARNHRRRSGLTNSWQRLVGPTLSSQRVYSPERDAISGELRARIGESLARLSPSQREAFSLVHLGGLSLRDAAESLGVAEGTLKSHLSRALHALRDDLGPLYAESKGETS